jgi:hypothetical protein
MAITVKELRNILDGLADDASVLVGALGANNGILAGTDGY